MDSVGTMELTNAQQAMLGGDQGNAKAFAMEMLVKLGTIAGAERFVEVSSAHIDGCLYHGQVSLDFVNRLVHLGGSVSVPTTLNVSSLDRMTPSLVKLPPEEWEASKQLMDAYEKLGCTPTWTCAPYQLQHRPEFGQQLAWAESNAIVFANSVLGARTNRYGDFSDICAAITGVVPAIGLHVTENRKATWLFSIQLSNSRWLDGDLLYSLAGYLVGSQCGFHVPAIEGLPASTTEDQLKSFGATAASSGSLAMFHAIGLTPEASTMDEAFHGAAPSKSTILYDRDFEQAFDRLNTLKAGDRITAVSLGTPHFSMTEFSRLLPKIQGKKRHRDVEFFVSTSRVNIQQLKASGASEILREFGATVVVDTCTYITPILRLGRGQGAVMTNSGKWAHYAPANLGVQVALGKLDDCIESAVRGVVWQS